MKDRCLIIVLCDVCVYVYSYTYHYVCIVACVQVIVLALHQAWSDKETVPGYKANT